MKYVRMSQLTVIVPMSKATIWRMVKDSKNTFPKPVKLGERITAWHMDDIEAWLTSLHEGG
jgi:predicted DNA-binding transcriptional regulator AlpA